MSTPTRVESTVRPPATWMLVAVATVGTITASTTARVTPTRLRCEYAANPLGIDAARPRLGWVLQADRRAEAQTAYQILVASSSDKLDRNQADLWDSGKVASDESTHAAYGGRTLSSGTREHWKVRVWDRDNGPCEYSEPAWWEMGLLEPTDWTARWIALDESQRLGANLEFGDWIWSSEAVGDKRIALFRRAFSIDPARRLTEAVVKINADNAFDLYVNGGFVGHDVFWNVPREYIITPDLRPEVNVIAVRVINSIDPGGLRAALRLQFADGETLDLRSDTDWRTRIAEQPDWNQPDFDDSTWTRAVVLPPDTADRWRQIKDPFGPPRSVCARKTFKLHRPVARARAYASGLGLYELHINGRRVGDDIFTPGWTDYHKRVQYQTYDVTPLLREGDNALGAILGNGWFSGDLGWAAKPPFSQGPLRFLLQLDIEYDDGTCDRIVTDRLWHTQPSPITRNTFYHGETYDARMEMPGWSTASFDDSQWAPAVTIDAPTIDRLVAQQCETIRVTQELRAVAIAQPAPGVHVFDFGQNAAGWARLKVRGPRGTRVRLRFAELLKPDGNIYRDNLRSAEATDWYVLSGDGDETWEPRFTYHGFRYCEVTGYPGTPTSDSLVFRVVHSAVEPTGRFDCSNPLLNQIWRNVTWSQRSNMHSVWTDCPQRDERLGWTGDAVAIGPTACWNMQMARFLGKWMRDFGDAQADDGGVPEIVPNILGGGAGAPGWSDAVTILPWTVYQFYGDKRIIEENYEAMVRWVEYMRRHSQDGLYQRGGYGDWVAPDKSPAEPIGAAYYYYSARLLARMAGAIGRRDDADKYAQLARQIGDAFNSAYLDRKTHQYPGGTQTAHILPLYFGLVPLNEIAAVAHNLVRDIEARGHHLSTGFQGTAYLMPTLAQCGQHDIAYKLATQTTCPSWGYMVTHGATTIWELWDADRKGPEMNSRNHAALGAVGRWFFETLAGINLDPSAPGFKHVIIRPTPVGDLTHAGAEFDSVRGLVASKWRINDGRFVLNVTVPVGSIATVFVPATDPRLVTESGVPADQAEGVQRLREEAGSVVYRVGSGQYEFVVTSR